MNKPSAFLTASLLAISLLSSCATVGKDNLLQTNGMIYDLDNKPVNDVVVSISGKSVTSTDINGHFSLPTLEARKQYELNFSKPGFETVPMSLAYTDPSQVIYVKMASGNQLLSEAEKYLKTSDWKNASLLLDRASNTDCDRTDLAYLQASFLYLKKDYASALTALVKMIDSGVDEPYIYIFSADLLQYQLDDKESAANYLRCFLALSYDPDVQNRLNALAAEKDSPRP